MDAMARNINRPATPISNVVGSLPVEPIRKAHRGDSRKRESADRKTCRVCGKEGHLQKQCRQTRQSASGSVEQAAKLAVDQAHGAQIAAQDLARELREQKQENETLRRAHDILKEHHVKTTKEADATTKEMIHGMDFKTKAGHYTLFDRILFFIWFCILSWAKFTMGDRSPQWIMDRFEIAHDAAFDAWHDGITGPHLHWWEMAATRYRWVRDIELDGYPDARPDLNAMQVAKHFNPHYAVFEVSKRWTLLPDANVVICMELVSQLSAPQFFSRNDTPKTVWDRMMKTAAGYQWVNFNRYLVFEGHNVAMDSALIAFALYERTRERSIEFFCPAPRS